MRRDGGIVCADTRPQAVIFDFEGTLVDFQWDLKAAEREVRKILSDSGFASEPLAGENYAQLWNRAVNLPGGGGSESPLVSRLEEVYDHYDMDALTRWKPREEAKDVLGALRRAGVACAVVSNVGGIALKSALTRFGLASQLDSVICRNDVERMKPAADGLNQCLQALGTDADRTLFVGDSLSDVRAARAAGVPVVIVTGGESAVSDFDGEPPDRFIDGLAAVKPLVGT